MVSSIILGNVSQQNGRNVVTGSSSGGLDTQALVEALTTAKRLPAVQLESRIETNTTKSTAYNDMRDILSRFQDAANFLRNPPGVANESENTFEYRTASVSNSGATAGSNYLSVNVEPGVDISNYDVTVDQLATYNVKVTNTFALADADTAAVGAALPFAAGTYAFGAAGVNVTFNAGDTLNQVASRINAVSSQTQVKATVIQVSAGNYALSLKTTDTGADLNYATPAGFAAGGWLSEVDALDSQMSIDGITVTRHNNSIDDAIDGVTFNLLAETPATDTLKVGVSADKDVVKSAILHFVDAYNEFKIFAAKQMETGDDGKPLDTSVLISSSTLRSTLTRVNNEMASVVQGLASGSADRLSDIGITFNDYPGDKDTPFVRNILNVDESKLDSALASNFQGVKDVFAFDFTTDNPNLTVFSRTNKLDASSVSLNLSPSLGIYEATYDNGSGPVTVNLDATTLAGGGGVVLKGQAGTALEGLTLIYASTTDAVVQLDMTQGVADRVYNSLGDVLKTDNGSLQNEITSLNDSSTRLQTEIDRIDKMVEDYRNQLLDKFSALESAIAQANTLLQSLKAQADARLSG